MYSVGRMPSDQEKKTYLGTQKATVSPASTLGKSSEVLTCTDVQEGPTTKPDGQTAGE